MANPGTGPLLQARDHPRTAAFTLACAEGTEALPVAIRNLGPWSGGPEGNVERLCLPYRVIWESRAAW